MRSMSPHFHDHSGRTARPCAARGRGALPPWMVWLFASLSLLALTLPGCGGCQAEADKKTARKPDQPPKPKPKPDFEKLDLQIEPHDRENTLRSIKPGHWSAASLQTTANNFDFVGDFEASPTTGQGQLVDLEGTAYSLAVSRPAILPKGQPRRLQVPIFVPRGGQQTWLTAQLRDRGGREARRETELYRHMPSYQYFLLRLVAEPNRYRFLNALPSVRPPGDDMTNGLADFYYRVELTHGAVPLPTNSLCWTSLAAIVWDDFDPSLFDAEQQQALLDWLHWGGQIIVVGPKTLDRLKPSFLDPYLPADPGPTVKLDEAALADFNAAWTIPAEGSRPLGVTGAWSAVTLAKRPEANFMPAAEGLVAERAVGRGRIVVTSFRLTERDLLNWPSYDSFFNACLLRRPARSYQEHARFGLRLDWAGMTERHDDSGLIIRLRYFARDSSLAAQARSKPVRNADEDDPFADANGDSGINPFTNYTTGNFDPFLSPEERQMQQNLSDSGTAGWNDFSPAASAARKALKSAAGINIPQRGFVFKVLLTYLLVIVPLNWLVFRLLGRVEWAWVAAPLIAIVFAGAVAWLAQLDIGFARSTTEIAIVEMHAGYPRAHVTRYTALYTSLSTGYDIHFDQASAVALPFATDIRYSLLAGQQRSTVTLRNDGGVHLLGMAVASNSTGMVHSEHMADLAGGVTLDASGPEWRIANGSGLQFQQGTVFRCDTPGTLQAARLDTLGTGESASLSFETVPERERPADKVASDTDNNPADNANGSPAADEVTNALSLQALIALSGDPEQFSAGDVRLVAEVEGQLPGMTIVPSAAQERHATLAVVHLRHSTGDAPQRDTNVRQTLERLDALEPDSTPAEPTLPEEGMLDD